MCETIGSLTDRKWVLELHFLKSWYFTCFRSLNIYLENMNSVRHPHYIRCMADRKRPVGRTLPRPDLHSLYIRDPSEFTYSQNQGQFQALVENHYFCNIGLVTNNILKHTKKTLEKFSTNWILNVEKLNWPWLLYLWR